MLTNWVSLHVAWRIANIIEEIKFKALERTIQQKQLTSLELIMVFLCLCDSSLVNKVFSILGKKKKNASSLEEAIAPEIPSVLQHDVVIN